MSKTSLLVVKSDMIEGVVAADARKSFSKGNSRCKKSKKDVILILFAEYTNISYFVCC